MIEDAILPNPVSEKITVRPAAAAPRRHRSMGPISFRVPEYDDQSSSLHHAELFYLQKQIQSQTPMVIVMEDGETIEGCIEWYDRGALKVRGRARTLIYKSAIKYMYKQGENGS